MSASQRLPSLAMCEEDVLNASPLQSFIMLEELITPEKLLPPRSLMFLLIYPLTRFALV